MKRESKKLKEVVFIDLENYDPWNAAYMRIYNWYDERDRKARLILKKMEDIALGMRKPNHLLEIDIVESENRFFKLYNLYVELLKILAELPIYNDREDFMMESGWMIPYCEDTRIFREDDCSNCPVAKTKGRCYNKGSMFANICDLNDKMRTLIEFLPLSEEIRDIGIMEIKKEFFSEPEEV